jgi:hypothetical protein
MYGFNGGRKFFTSEHPFYDAENKRIHTASPEYYQINFNYTVPKMDVGSSLMKHDGKSEAIEVISSIEHEERTETVLFPFTVDMNSGAMSYYNEGYLTYQPVWISAYLYFQISFLRTRAFYDLSLSFLEKVKAERPNLKDAASALKPFKLVCEEHAYVVRDLLKDFEGGEMKYEADWKASIVQYVQQHKDFINSLDPLHASRTQYTLGLDLSLALADLLGRTDPKVFEERKVFEQFTKKVIKALKEKFNL